MLNSQGGNLGCSFYSLKNLAIIIELTRVGLEIVIRVNMVKGSHYQALTRFRYQRSENRLEDETSSWDPHLPNFTVLGSEKRKG